MKRRRRIGLAAAAASVAAALWLRMDPLPAGLLEPPRAESTTVLDRNGEVLYEARAGDGGKASWLAAGALPDVLIDATVAAEDRRFWRHPGVDPLAIARAALHDVRRGGFVEGGSTITQQVAKMLLARAEGSAGRRGFLAKAREAAIALRLEHRLAKREILALYLNLSPYGNQLTGAERASRAYFGHGAAMLTPAQAAFLAALPQRPSWFNPYKEPNRARARQERVITAMGLIGALTPDAVRDAMDERLSFSRESSAFLAPHFVERVLAAAGPDRPRSIVTTLDAELQRQVAGIIRAERPNLDRYGAHNVAAVVLDNATGEWLAWEGSGDYADADHGGTIDGVVEPRQPGSALKPFTYAVAFEQGESPATVLPDVPSYFPTAEEGVLYSPRNYDGRFRGPLLARHALAGSENVPAVVLASRVGVPNLMRFLRASGFDTLEMNAGYYGLGVTLGDAEVRLDQLVAAYAAFARGGLAATPTFVHGGGRRAASRTARRLVSERTAFWITDILSDDEARAFVFGRGGSLEFPFPVAAKTGTSQGYHDNWAVGYTRDVTVGVWVGNFDRKPLVGSSGVSGAGPIFHDIMMAAVERALGSIPHTGAAPTAAAPERTERRLICALSGMTATAACPSAISEWVAEGAADHACTWHVPTAEGVLIEWPADYHSWARAEGRLGRARSLSTPSAVRGVPETLRIVNPPDGATYLIDPTLRSDFQAVPLRAVPDQDGALQWRVDGEPVAARGGRMEWPLAPGRHIVTVIDSMNRRASADIIVK